MNETLSQILLTVLSSVGASVAATGVLGSLLALLGKRHLDRSLELERARHQETLEHVKGSISESLEVQRARLAHARIFFDRQSKACGDLFQLTQDLLPPFNKPDMEWEQDVCEFIAHRFEQVENDARNFLATHYPALPAGVPELVNTAIGMAGDGKFDIDEDGRPNLQALRVADEVYHALNKATAQLKSHIDDQTHPPLVPAVLRSGSRKSPNPR